MPADRFLAEPTAVAEPADLELQPTDFVIPAHLSPASWPAPVPLGASAGHPSIATRPDGSRPAEPARSPDVSRAADVASLTELAGLADLGPVTGIVGKLDAVQVEVDALRSELNTLRRRDETLNFYIHRLDEELRLAARLQQDFLPKTLPEVGPIRFHTLFRPAGYVSGDLYDATRLDERHVGVYVADAVGHGMPAALLTMFLKQALVTKQIRPGGYDLIDPGVALAGLNAALIEQQLTQATFATALYASIDVDTLALRLAKAGHPSPLLVSADGACRWLDVEGPLLGIFPDETFRTEQIQLARGDRLVIYTDGIEVAFPDLATPGPEPRWQQELLRLAALGAEELLHEFSAQMDREAGSLDPRDDVTVVVLEVLP